MPIYEYSCINQCDNYEIWCSIDERIKVTNCPSCNANGSRVFAPIMSLSGNFRLRQEETVPTIVQKAINKDAGKQRLKESKVRPWMLNRGC